MRKVVCAILLLFAGEAVLPAADASFDEMKKQEEFKKTYSSQPDHLKALALLEGASHPSTWELLIKVARVDASPEVRYAAFKMLCAMPAHTPKLAETLATLFGELKNNDIEARTKYAEEMAQSEFKFQICETLAGYGANLRYPSLYTGAPPPGAGGGASFSGGDPNVVIKKQRKEFEKFLEAFNKVSGATLLAKDKYAPSTIKKWWEDNKAKVLAEDREKAQKYGAEDKAGQPQGDNPLLPRSGQKKTE
ncbi:MAG: hypothetical protein ABSE73_05220 [Planctomycetota bacterium]